MIDVAKGDSCRARKALRTHNQHVTGTLSIDTLGWLLERKMEWAYSLMGISAVP